MSSSKGKCRKRNGGQLGTGSRKTGWRSWPRIWVDQSGSTSLAQIFVTLLSEKGEDFKAFVMNADWRDAGQDAAVAILNRDLGEVAAGFLGPGEWRPQRKAISGYFEKSQSV